MQLPRQILIPAVVAGLALGGWFIFGGESSAPNQRPGANAARPVTATTVTREAFDDRIEALGTVHASESVNVTAKVQGIIRSIYFDDGATVKRGQEIAAIDSGEQVAALNVELANLEQQRKELDRTLGLAKENHISQARVDEQTAALKKAEAGVAAARVRAGDRLISAPFDGIVGTRRISVGALVTPGTVVTTLDDISTVKLDFAVPETFLASLQPGLPIEATASAYPGHVFTGDVIAIDSRVDPTTRAVTVRAEIANADLRLRPGMLMVVDLIKDRRESVAVPESSLFPENNNQYVFVIGSENTVRRVQVQIGNRRPGLVEVLQGVQEGDVIVREGVQDLRDGTKVDVVNGAELNSQPAHATRLVEPS